MSEVAGGAGTLLRADTITKEYRSGRQFSIGRQKVLTAVNEVSLGVDPEEALGLVGESGSGKSTTGRMLLGLEEPTRGRVLYRDRDLAGLTGPDWTAYRQNVQAVFQDPWSSLNPRRRIGASIAEPLQSIGALSKDSRSERVEELLALVGLSERLANQFPHELSGGMRQRVSIARAIATEPSLIVLDEPVSSLDVSIRAQVMNLLKDLKDRLRMSYVLIAHDLATVRFLANRIVVLSRGSVVESAETELLFANPLHRATRDLINSSRAKSISVQAGVGKGYPRPVGGSPSWDCGTVGDECLVGEASGLAEVEAGHLVACGVHEQVNSLDEPGRS